MIIADALRASGLAAQRLELEITETAILGDKKAALGMLTRLKQLGVTLAIDDFGTGYSSLGVLHAFPIDKIKLDRSFLLGADQSEQAQAIIRTVVALGRSLAVAILAEGVEVEAQMEMLSLIGCDEAQGFYFGRPQCTPASRTMATDPARASPTDTDLRKLTPV